MEKIKKAVKEFKEFYWAIIIFQNCVPKKYKHNPYLLALKYTYKYVKDNN